METNTSGIIHLLSETEEFYNKNHGKDGRFAPGGNGGKKATKAETAHNAAKDLEDELNHTFGADTVNRIKAEGHKVEDYDFRDKEGKLTGKPLPGSDSWRSAHGISKEVYDSRPTKRFSGPKDPVLDEVYKDVSDPNQKRFTKNRVASQSPGFIMQRVPLPGAEKEFGPIPPQARPDNKVVVDGRARAKKQQALNSAIRRQENLKTYTGQDIINERQARVTKLTSDLKKAKSLDKEDLTGPAKRKLDIAEKKLSAAEKTGDEGKIAAARRERKIAENELKDASKKGNLINAGDRKRAVEIVQNDLNNAKIALDRAKADPDKALKNARDAADHQVIKKQASLDKTAVKYAFPPGKGSASRMEAHQDPQNIKNLVEGKGRVYFVMEGQIKADSVLTAIKKEDPTAAVVSVPSVTAWNEKEVSWATKKYFQGRDIVLIPDADGVSNTAVVKQANTLKGRMETDGAGSVHVASPPLVRNKRGNLEVEDIWYPTGVKDGRKGVDDHLGLGHGTLGDLTFNDTPKARFDLGGDGKLRKNSVSNANTVMSALSDLSGESGAGRISKKSISKYTGLPESSVHDSLKNLEKNGYIKRYDIFDPKALEIGRREPTMEYDEIKRITKKAGVSVPDLDTKYVFNDEIHETAPIYEIKDSKYITKPGPSKNLASVYKNLQTSDRIVRTPEGAAKYGVSVGQKIPGAFSTSGFITLSSATEEFFNKCHGKSDGKFCKGPDGGGRIREIKDPKERAAAEAEQKAFIKKQKADESKSKPASKPETKPAMAKSPISDPKIQKRITAANANQKKSSHGELVGEAAWKAARIASRNKYIRKWAIRAALAYAAPIGLKFGANKLIKAYATNQFVGGENAVMARTKYQSIKAENGQILKLYDTTGKLTKEESDLLLNSLKEAHKLHPVGGDPPNIIVHDQHPMAGNAYAFVVGRKDTRTIHVNWDVLKPEAAEAKTLHEVTGGEYKSGWFGDTYAANPEKYIIFHEYGHIADYSSRKPQSTLTGKLSFARGKLIKGEGNTFSKYGQTSKEESYAESFADWYTSGGKTTNQATNLYAKTYKWNK